MTEVIYQNDFFLIKHKMIFFKRMSAGSQYFYHQGIISFPSFLWIPF